MNPLPGHLNPAYILTPYFSKIHDDIFIESASWSAKWSHPFRFSPIIPYTFLVFLKPTYKFGPFVQCQRVWIAEGGTNYWAPAIRKRTQGPNMLHMFLFLSVVSLLADCNPFRRSPRHTATESQSFRFNVKIFCPVCPCWVAGYAPEPEPGVGGRSLHDCSQTSRRAPVTDPPVLRAVSSAQWFLTYVFPGRERNAFPCLITSIVLRCKIIPHVISILLHNYRTHELRA